jgi:hypothetical protein
MTESTESDKPETLVKVAQEAIDPECLYTTKGNDQ